MKHNMSFSAPKEEVVFGSQLITETFHLRAKLFHEISHIGCFSFEKKISSEFKKVIFVQKCFRTGPI